MPSWPLNRGTLRAPWIPAALPATLLVVSLPLLRPGVFGERTALVGFVLALAAGVTALVRREHVTPRPVPAASLMAVLLMLAYVWMLLRTIWIDTPTHVRDAFQDFALTLGSVGAAVLALADPEIRRATGRGVILLLAVLSAGWVVTALWWAVAGIGSGVIGLIPVGGAGAQPVYFPFTISYSTFSVFGVDVPRLTGIGRESGWMGMFCAAGWFLVDALGYRGRRRVVLKALMVAGLVGTLSTAGFGVFVVVVAYDLFLRPRGEITLVGFVRQLAGLGAIGLAVWAAAAAPVLGLAAKQTGNEASLDERQDATEAGLRALTQSPLGGHGTEKQSGVNLVSDISINGLPFVLLVTAALLVPLLVARRGPGSTDRGGPVALVVFATLLLSQPAATSTWVFILVALAFACDDLTDAERAGDVPDPEPEPEPAAVAARGGSL